MIKKEELQKECARKWASDLMKEVIRNQINDGRYYAALCTYCEGIIKKENTNE